jgi:hypothetical protein
MGLTEPMEHQIRSDLEGLVFAFGKPLMPHPNIELWVEAQFQELVSGGRSVCRREN